MIFDIAHKRMRLAIEELIQTKKPNTKRAYLAVWTAWVEFLGKRKLNKADVVDVAKFMEQISKRNGQTGRFDGNRKAAQSTIAHRLSVMKTFYELAIGMGIVNKNPFANSCFDYLRRYEFNKRPTDMLDFESVMKLINTPCECSKEGVRDRAILALLFGGALRRTETTEIRIADIKLLDDGCFSVFLRNTKNGESITQPLPNWVSPYLSALVVQRKAEGATEFCFLLTDYFRLFNQSDKKPLDSKTVYRILKRHAVQCGLSEHITPHSARATAITRLLELGVTHREVGKFSRHSSTASVEKYDKRRKTVSRAVANLLKY